jgi:hypothetical protein
VETSTLVRKGYGRGCRHHVLEELKSPVQPPSTKKGVKPFATVTDPVETVLNSLLNELDAGALAARRAQPQAVERPGPRGDDGQVRLTLKATLRAGFIESQTKLLGIKTGNGEF